MMTLLLGLAVATPPLPTWGANDREPVDPPLAEQAAQANPGSVPDPAGRRTFAANDVAPGAWADEANLVVSFSGDLGKAYFLMGTVRGEGLVAHFRQGPIAGENLTADVPITLPEDLDRPLSDLGTAHLTLRLAITTLDGRDLGQQALASTHLSYDDGVVRGGQRTAADTVLADDDTFAPEPSQEAL